MSSSYFIKEYPYRTRSNGEQVGSAMKIWDGDNPYYFFLEVSKSLYNYLMNRVRDHVVTIVWNGVLYEYVNPYDVLGGIFIYRSQYGRERMIDLRSYIAKTQSEVRRSA